MTKKTIVIGLGKGGISAMNYFNPNQKTQKEKIEFCYTVYGKLRYDSSNIYFALTDDVVIYLL